MICSARDVSIRNKPVCVTLPLHFCYVSRMTVQSPQKQHEFTAYSCVLRLTCSFHRGSLSCCDFAWSAPSVPACSLFSLPDPSLSYQILVTWLPCPPVHIPKSSPPADTPASYYLNGPSLCISSPDLSLSVSLLVNVFGLAPAICLLLCCLPALPFFCFIGLPSRA